MSNRHKNQNETVNTSVDNAIANAEEETKMEEKKSLGTKVGETLKKVKDSKATKVVVTTLGAAALAAGAYFAGKKGLPKLNSEDDYYDDDFVDLDADESETAVETESKEN